MQDIVARLRESSHELQCRCVDAASEIELLREALGLCEMALLEWDNEGLAAQAKAAIADAGKTPMARLFGCCADETPNEPAKGRAESASSD